MARLYGVPDQPAPAIDPAQEIRDVRVQVEALRLNPMLTSSTRVAADAFADLLGVYDKFGAP